MGDQLTLPANIRVNVSAPFPARVTGANFITVSKANGIWTIQANYSGLQSVPVSVAIANQVFAIYDPTSGLFWKTTVLALLNAAIAVPYRLVTAAGAVIGLGSDGDILINKTVPAVTWVTLPAASVAIRPISVVDYAGNAFTYNITVFPSGSETINGAPSALISQDNGALTFYPIAGTGWYLK